MSRVSLRADPCWSTTSPLSVPNPSLLKRSNRASTFSFVTDESYRAVKQILRQGGRIVPCIGPGKCRRSPCITGYWLALWSNASESVSSLTVSFLIWLDRKIALGMAARTVSISALHCMVSTHWLYGSGSESTGSARTRSPLIGGRHEFPCDCRARPQGKKEGCCLVGEVCTETASVCAVLIMASNSALVWTVAAEARFPCAVEYHRHSQPVHHGSLHSGRLGLGD